MTKEIVELTEQQIRDNQRFWHQAVLMAKPGSQAQVRAARYAHMYDMRTGDVEAGTEFSMEDFINGNYGTLIDGKVSVNLGYEQEQVEGRLVIKPLRRRRRQNRTLGKDSL